MMVVMFTDMYTVSDICAILFKSVNSGKNFDAEIE